MAALAGGSQSPIHRHYRPQNLSVSSTSPLHSVFHPVQFLLHPGNRNCKADALSRFHSLNAPSDPQPILPPALIISPIIWKIDEEIRAATLTKPDPLGGPEGKTFVPTSQRQSLLGSVHSVPCSGHPGSQWTLSLL